MKLALSVLAELFHGKGRKRRKDYVDKDASDFEADNLCFRQRDEHNNKCRKLKSTNDIVVPIEPQCEIVSQISIWLEDDKVNTIGIYGMGGIGKTTVMKQLHQQQLLMNHAVATSSCEVDNSGGVAWVSVGSDFSIYNLQRQIADAVGLNLQDNNDLSKRAASLYAFLARLSWRIIFLDDLWHGFRVEQVGIPELCKVILSSRSMDVCRALRCQKVIKVDPLLVDKSWELFYRTADNRMLDSKDIFLIGKKMCDFCGGVPRAIHVLAKSMRRVDDASGWSEALDRINENSRGLETVLDDTLNSLKRSYDSLSNATIQNCLLYCALYPKGDAIRKEELIRHWIGENLIDENVESLQAQYDSGHSIVNKLLNSCLLETSEDGSMVKIHDLIKRMALSISRDSFKETVNPCFMKDSEYCKKLQVLSLIKSIHLVTFDASPKCSGLTTLLLQHSYLNELPDSVFVHMSALRVLNLSHTFIDKLPSSVSKLHELRCLDISHCRNLKQLPSIANQKKLRYLNLSKTAIGQAPHGLDELENLTELNICATFDKLNTPLSVLSSLSRLRSLSCDIVNSVVLQSFKSLEILDTKFADYIDMSKYVRSHHWHNLKSYHLQVGHRQEPKRPYSKAVSLHNCSLNGEYIALPDNIRELNVDHCQGLSSLTDILKNVDEQCGPTRQASPFSSLETCTVRRCHDVEQLFTVSLIQKLPLLESIVVEDCKQLREIIADDVAAESRRHETSDSHVILPRLRRLVIDQLPRLSSICKSQLGCALLRSPSITGCPRLKNLPFLRLDID